MVNVSIKVKSKELASYQVSRIYYDINNFEIETLIIIKK